MKTLYITHNGIADHIGQSQIAPYLLGLAKLGHDIHLLSLEKPGKDAIIRQYQAAFDQAGIRWTRLRYHRFPPLAAHCSTRSTCAARRLRSRGASGRTSSIAEAICQSRRGWRSSGRRARSC